MLADFRARQGRTQEEFAGDVGLGSKGYISGLESGTLKAPLRLALKIHALSAGEVPAHTLVSDEDAELLAAYRANPGRVGS